MSEFFSSRSIKAVRKERHCESCGTKIMVGQPARYFATKQEGDMFCWHAHPECRDAEVAWNTHRESDVDDFLWLWQAKDGSYHDSEEARETSLEWLREHHPIAAGRILP